MEYIPPHKRYSEDNDKAGPSPALLVPQFRRNLSLGSPKSKFDWKNVMHKHKLPGGKIIYADGAASRWLTVGASNDVVLPLSVTLQPVLLGSVKVRDGERPLVLVDTEVDKTTTDIEGSLSKSPWVAIAENVLQDLLSSFQIVRKEMESNNLVEVKPALIARFGKILFHPTPSFDIETIEKKLVSQSALRKFKKSFCTNMPSPYLEDIKTGVAQDIGLDAEEEKETYHVKLSDNEQPDATISCKCTVNSDGRRLELYKIELNQVRHAVMDISCLTKKLDLRLMLCTKRIISTLSDDDKCSIQDIISSAVVDLNTKGGLRWPLGKDCSNECRYRVVGVWHTKAESFKNSNIRLRVRNADRFDFRTSSGELSREVVLKLRGVISKLKEPNVEVSSILDVLVDSIRVMWNHFLHCDTYLDLDSTISS